MLVYAQKAGFLAGQLEQNPSFNPKHQTINSKNQQSTIVKSISKTIHRRSKRNSLKVKQQMFCAIGVNVNGIKGKWSTLKNVVNKT